MEASMKKWFVIPAVLVVLLAGSAAALLLSLNSLIVREVNSVGPELTGTAVRLEKADVSLFSGTGVFTGFIVGNPKGFTDTPALSVGSLGLELVPSSVLEDTVVIPKIEIIRPDVLYELAEDTSNIETILKHVRNVAEKKKAESEFVEQKSIADEGDQRCPCGNRKAARKKGDACCQNLTLEREALRTASDAPRGSGRCEDGGGGL